MTKVTITIEDVTEDGEPAISLTTDFGEEDSDHVATQASTLAAGIGILFKEGLLYEQAEEIVKLRVLGETVLTPKLTLVSNKDAA